MYEEKIKTVILSLDNSFGTINFGSHSGNIVNIDLRSHTVKCLSEIHGLGIDSIIIVNSNLVGGISSEHLRRLLPQDLRLIMSEDIRNTLLSYLRESDEDAQEAMFVSEDRVWRGIAAECGFITVPHPSIAMLRINESSLHFVRVIGEEKQLKLLNLTIPYYISYLDDDEIMALGVMSDTDITRAIANKLVVDILPLDIPTEDPLYVSIDRTDDNTSEKLRGRKILSFDGHRALIALDPSTSNDSIPFHDMHGHFLFLSPNPTLLKPASVPENLLRKSEMSLTRWPLKKIKVGSIARDTLTPLLDIVGVRKPIEMEFIDSTVNRYSGKVDLDGNGRIKSRHCEHPDNSRVVSALVNDLRSMGYSPFIHTFQYRSKILSNVIADLPGTGYFQSEPHLPERIREIFLKHPPYPAEPWTEEIRALTGADWMMEQNLDALSPFELRAELEQIFLKDSSWWMRDVPLRGLGGQVVVVCSHFDSTAGREPLGQYDKMVDIAPGADDNGSGMAGVLAIAKYLSRFRGKLLHTIRFCFFNAEEVGLIGSKAFAPTQKDKDVAIKAVINMDMLGYNSDNHRTFEIHAGYPNRVIRDLCLPIADLIKQWSENLGKLGNAQIYKGTSQGGPRDYDRDLYDGAIERSDHFAFQQEGYPACHISEDFFANYPTESSDDPNPNYHRFADNTIDLPYTSDIVTAAALAIKELASK